MRVLLDACVPEDLRHHIFGHDVETARYAGLSHLSNGALLSAMAGRFDVLAFRINTGSCRSRWR